MLPFIYVEDITEILAIDPSNPARLVLGTMASESQSEDRAEPVLERKITIKNEGLVTSLEKRIQAKPPSISPEHCIFRVPERLRKLNEDAFTPQVVSLGPLHRDKLQQFKAIENHKLHYLNAFLSHQSSNNQSSTPLMNKCVDKLKGIEQQVRDCYAEETELSSEEFVEMMMLDGCFVIEFFLRDWKPLLREQYDPLFDNLHFHRAFEDDLLLLENQLPFVVFKTLFDVVNNDNTTKLWDISFLGLAMKYYEIENLSLLHEPKHLLDLVLQQYIPSEISKEKGNESQERFRIIPSAVHLWEAGVIFKPPEEKRHLLDVSFANGVLEIPVIDIEDQTESLFRNLIAFEQCYKHSTYVGDYTALMDHLIDTENDVALLRRKEVITNWLGDDGEVSDMFNKLGKNVVTSKDFHYVHLYNQLNAYYRTPWHKWTATLKRDYFNTPWSAIAFVAAAIGIICTVIQTMQAFQEK